VKRYSFQKRLSKFTPKRFYEINSYTRKLLTVFLLS
jgi:hypothetical protein